jgi:hypothetical protein
VTKRVVLARPGCHHPLHDDERRWVYINHILQVDFMPDIVADSEPSRPKIDLVEPSSHGNDLRLP